MKVAAMMFSALLLLSSATMAQGLCEGCEWYTTEVSKDNSVTSVTTEKAPGSTDPSGWCQFGWDAEGFEECTTDIGCSGSLIVTVKITGLQIGEWINSRWDNSGGPVWTVDEIKFGEQLNPYTHVVGGTVSGDCGTEMADLRVELADRKMGQVKKVLLNLKIYCAACFVVQ